MNTAYKNFLKDALSDYCNSNGIDLGDLIDHIEFRADHPFTVSDGNGGKRVTPAIANESTFHSFQIDSLNQSIAQVDSDEYLLFSNNKIKCFQEWYQSAF